MISKNIDRWKTFFFPHGLIYSFLIVIIIVLTILTVVYGSLWRKNRHSILDNKLIGSPIRLPKSDRSIQWTLLQMNDVYELLPLDRGRKGGLARVATIRQLLRAENPHTYTILAGDLLSPSAIGVAKVNGSMLSGRQMVLTMNELGLDMMTFGNHEFDLTENDLLERMNESKFTWISSNVFRKNSSDLFGPSISHRLITIDRIRVLFIGLTIDGTGGAYVDIVNQTSLFNHVQQFLNTFPNGTYDVLVAITHLDMAIDIALTTKVPQIDLILGGHEHENYYYRRGTKYTPIAKADANAFTVYIHRCIFNLDKRQFDVQSTLTRVTPDFPDEEKTAAVANYWFNLGIEGFEASGYKPNEIVGCLPPGLDFDGRSEFVRSTITELTAAICESVLYKTQSYQTTVGLINGGTVRVDDILRETITQYDILRTLPFANYIVALSVPGTILAEALTIGQTLKGNGMYLAYVGVETRDGGRTWLIDGVDITKSGLEYRVATNDYLQNNTVLKNSNVTVLYSSDFLQAKVFMDYLTVKYPPC